MSDGTTDGLIRELEAEIERLKAERDEIVERCAQIAENVFIHTASMTVERDMAHRILPRAAKAIRALTNSIGR